MKMDKKVPFSERDGSFILDIGAFIFFAFFVGVFFFAVALVISRNL